MVGLDKLVFHFGRRIPISIIKSGNNKYACVFDYWWNNLLLALAGQAAKILKV